MESSDRQHIAQFSFIHAAALSLSAQKYVPWKSGGGDLTSRVHVNGIVSVSPKACLCAVVCGYLT